MRIALSMRRTQDPCYGEIRDTLSVDWVRFIRGNWPDVTLLPAVNAPGLASAWANDLDPGALILTNGNNWGADADRDATETELVSWCRHRQRPVLGVCRGLQALNVMFGGSLEASLRELVSDQHAGSRHEVRIVAGEYRNLAGTDTLIVNSFHDQGVLLSGLAAPLKPVAIAQNGVVEAFHHPDEAILAIQWHPERPGGPDSFNRLLIGRFLLGEQT